MASLAKQFSRIRPFLNDSVSDDELYRYVLNQQPEDYFKANDGNLLYILGSDERQRQIIPFSRNLARDFIEMEVIPKLSALFEQETNSKSFIVDEDSGWHVELNGDRFALGDLNLMYNWHVQGEKLKTPPDFFVNLANAFQMQVKTGTFYIGYLKDEEDRKRSDFIYCIVFVRNGKAASLDKLSDLYWQPLYKSAAQIELENQKYASNSFKKEGRIAYKQEGESIEMRWNSSNVFAMIFAYGLVLISVLDLLNPYFNINENSLPTKFATPFYLFSGIIFILFLLNRKSRLILTDTHLHLKKGLVPIFFGFRRKSIELKQILRLDQKHTDMQEGNDVAVTGSHYMYKIYLTVLPTKKVRLTNLLTQESADFIQKQIEKQLKRVN